MKSLVVCGCLTVFATSVALAQETPEFPAPQKEHEWLQQFAGEWETEGSALMGADQPEMKCKGTIKSRMLGGFWVVSELKSDWVVSDLKSEKQETPITGLQTIGYDAASKKYVGTWVDSMLGHMWKYEGWVDDSGKILTLEAEGPNFMQAGKLAKFRDVYEFKSKDHIATTSLMQGEDGKWITFMSGNAKRKK